MSSERRVIKEIRELEEWAKYSEVEGLYINPDADNIYNWTSVIIPQPNTIYENHIFDLDIVIPRDYPFHMPKIKFRSKIFHPNIDIDTGKICDLVDPESWDPNDKNPSCGSPSFTIVKYCLILIGLLDSPNVDANPMNPEALKLYQVSKELFKERVQNTIDHIETSHSHTEGIPIVCDLDDTETHISDIQMSGNSEHQEIIQRFNESAISMDELTHQMNSQSSEMAEIKEMLDTLKKT
jgi:ubiquitin-protein ligase